MIQIQGVTKTFRSGRGTVLALRNITISVSAGGFTVFMGKSGSGKSTLLNCIGGIEPPDEGEVSCFGTPIYTLHDRDLSLFQRRGVGFVFQRGNLLSYLTVAENIGFPLTLNGIVGQKRADRINDLLEKIDLVSADRAMPHELSGGETQRVAVARAIAHNPKMLLADEPTANLDTESGHRIVELMREMGQEQNCTIIMATHDADITRETDTVVHLQDGAIYKTDRLVESVDINTKQNK